MGDNNANTDFNTHTNTPATPAPVASIKDVKFTYPGQAESAIIDINSWEVDAGEHVFVAGSSGSGKSTLLGLLCGLILPDSGEVTVLGEALHTKSERQRDRFRAVEIGYVAQSFNLIPYLSAVDNIQLAISFAGKTKHPSEAADLDTLLQEVNLPTTHWQKPVRQLSIGQQQRVAIARAIVNKPRLIIADEPTSSLDQSNRDAFMAMLMATAERHHMTVIFVSHDLTLRDHFQRVDSMSEINTVGG